ncbi:MAG: hypothetical protein IJ047_05060 [Paludibacteraceae bacterium]|nr:hypothetical protein [Paludibacteraceae bacterium]
MKKLFLILVAAMMTASVMEAKTIVVYYPALRHHLRGLSHLVGHLKI